MRRGYGRHAWRFGSSAFTPLSLFADGSQGAWYDNSNMSTLFQDSAGTTPAVLESPVGLQLDLRNTAYSTAFNGTSNTLTLDGSSGFVFGAGDFTVEGWFNFQNVNTTQALIDFRIANGAFPSVFLEVNGNITYYTNSTSVITTPHGMSAGNWYHIALSKVLGNTRIFVNGVQKGSTYADSNTYSVAPARPAIGVSGIGSTSYLNGFISNLRIVKGTGLYASNFTPPTAPLAAISGTSLLTCGTVWSGNPPITSNASSSNLNPFVTGTGNHRSQATSANRPLLSARYNLLTKTEQFDNAAWVKIGATVTANAITSPDGTTTADLLVEVSGQSVAEVYQQLILSTLTYTHSVYCKAGARTWVYVRLATVAGQGAFFNLTTGTVGTVQSGITASITDAGNGWFKCTVSIAATAGSWYISVQPALGDNLPIVFGDGTSGIYIWGADLRPTDQKVTLPAYQRVDTSTVYDTTGFPQYIKYNGTAQYLSTASVDFTATAQMSVFSGVRKNSLGSAIGVIAELSAQVGANAGSFLLSSGGYASLGSKYGCALQGSTLIYSDSSATFIVPITNTLSTLMSIPAATPALQQILNINGVQQTVTQVGSGAGTGNFGNYALYFGERAGSSLAFNGQEYQMIIVGKTLTAAQITSTETYTNSKTKAY